MCNLVTSGCFICTTRSNSLINGSFINRHYKEFFHVIITIYNNHYFSSLDVCVTQEGKAKCAIIRKKLFRALERLLCRRLTQGEAHRLLFIIRTIVEKMNSYSEYNKEWGKKFLANPQIKWPRFILDLIVEDDYPTDNHSGDAAQNQARPS